MKNKFIYVIFILVKLFFNEYLSSNMLRISSNVRPHLRDRIKSSGTETSLRIESTIVSSDGFCRRTVSGMQLSSHGAPPPTPDLFVSSFRFMMGFDILINDSYRGSIVNSNEGNASNILITDELSHVNASRDLTKVA